MEDPSPASQPLTRSRNGSTLASTSSPSPILSTRGTRSHATRSSARHITSVVSDGCVRPSTRSRKRCTAEQPSPTQTVVTTQRKRARTKAVSLKAPPSVATKGDDDEKKPAATTENCCICMCAVETEDVAGINGCEHRFCFGCIEKWAERENTCPLCKNRFNKIERVNKKRRKGQKNSKKIKQRDQRSDLVPGAALEGLLGRMMAESRRRVPGRTNNDLTDFFSAANFASRHPNPPSIARLIFSGVGGINFDALHGPTARLTRHHTTTRTVTYNEDPSFSSDEEESPLSNFIRAFHSQGMMQVVRPVSLSAHIAASRSYASNVSDRNAGNRAENPLEIDDDSDDDAVEVVQVRRPA